MKIVRLEAENVKRLRAVTVEPDGSLVIVGGKNGAGKTSVLDSIQYALNGGRSLPEEPLRHGAKRGSIDLELDQGLHVRRTFTTKGSQLVVTQKNAEGEEGPILVKSPQQVLDALMGRISFDPLTFTRMGDRERIDMLRGMVPQEEAVQLASLAADRKAAFEERTALNREVRQLEGALATVGEQIEGEPEVPDAGALRLQLRDADVIDEQIRATEQVREEHDRRVAHALADVDSAKATLLTAEEALEVAKHTLQARLEHGEEIQRERDANFEGGLPEAIDREPILSQLEGIAAVQAEASQVQERNARREELRERRLLVKKHTGIIEDADEKREAILQATQLPVDGLVLDEDGVRVNGVPWEQASGAEQLRISVAMGLALNPTLKVLLVRDGSLLDEDSLRLLHEYADAADAQVWLEMVGDREDATVIIEDGHVQGEYTEEEIDAIEPMPEIGRQLDPDVEDLDLPPTEEEAEAIATKHPADEPDEQGGLEL